MAGWLSPVRLLRAFGPWLLETHLKSVAVTHDEQDKYLPAVLPTTHRYRHGQENPTPLSARARKRCSDPRLRDTGVLFHTDSADQLAFWMRVCRNMGVLRTSIGDLFSCLVVYKGIVAKPTATTLRIGSIDYGATHFRW